MAFGEIVHVWCPSGGEAFVFNSKGEIYLLPLIGMEQDAAVKLANSWKEFISHVNDVT